MQRLSFALLMPVAVSVAFDNRGAAYPGTLDFDSLGDHTQFTAYDNRVYGAWTEAAADSGAGRGTRPLTVVRIGAADFTGK